jgi:hypothetical protein
MQYFFDKNKTLQVHNLRFYLWLVLKGKIIGNKSPTMENLKRKIANEMLQFLLENWPQLSRKRSVPPPQIIYKKGDPDFNMFCNPITCTDACIFSPSFLYVRCILAVTLSGR